MTTAQAVFPKLTEKQWQEQVVQLAKLCGWLVYHTWNSMHSAAGFPDLVLVRDTRIVFAEVKSERPAARVKEAIANLRPPWLAHRDISDDQANWLGALKVIEEACASVDADGAPSVEVYVWRPSDMPVIQTILGRAAPAAAGAPPRDDVPLEAGQRRVTPAGQIVVITKVDTGRRLAWGQREYDGYKLAKGDPVSYSALLGWPPAVRAEITLRYSAALKANTNWCAIFASLLQVQRRALPAASVQHVEGYARLILPPAAKLPDVDAYRVAVTDGLARALVAAGVITDETMLALSHSDPDRDVFPEPTTITTLSWWA